jgi:hypothetical protein
MSRFCSSDTQDIVTCQHIVDMLVAACRKVSRRAAVARRKRNVFGKIRAQGNCGPRKQLAAAGRRITDSTKVARRKGQNKDDVTPRCPKVRTFGKRRWKGPECNNDIRDPGLRQQLRGRERIKNPDTRRQLRLKIDRTSEDFDRNALGLQSVKRATGMSAGCGK